MALISETGTVYAIVFNPDGTPTSKGRVQQDGTNPDGSVNIYEFIDSNFPTSGLQVLDKCSYTLDDSTNIATGLVAVNNNPTIINGPSSAPITANKGDVIIVRSKNALVTADVTINGGEVIVEQNAQITGNVTVNTDGVFTARKGGQLNGGVVLSTGGNLRVVNQGKMNGSVTAAQAGRMMIGNNNGGGFITGAIDIQKIRNFDITPESKING